MITRIAGALAALCFLASSLFGQVDARIVGSVVDPTGAAVPNATVSLLLSGGTAARYTTQTSSAGEFTIPSINPGSYSLVVEAKDENAVAFYRRQGFRPFASRPRTLFLPLATLRQGAADERPPASP